MLNKEMEPRTCAKPGCTRPVMVTRSGPPSKYCSKAHKNADQVRRHRQKKPKAETEREERLRSANYWIGLYEAKERGVMPPGHREGCDGNGSMPVCCAPGAIPWTLGQPNELTPDECDILAGAREMRERLTKWGGHLVGCDRKGANPDCCGVIEPTAPEAPRLCEGCGELLSAITVRFGWLMCAECRKKRDAAWMVV